MPTKKNRGDMEKPEIISLAKAMNDGNNYGKGQKKVESIEDALGFKGKGKSNGMDKTGQKPKASVTFGSSKKSK